MYYMFKYLFGITTTLIESLRSQNTHFRARFKQTSYKDLVFARGEFLSVAGAQNESIRLIKIYYFKLHMWDLNNFARFTSEPKNPSKGSILAKLVTKTYFLCEVTLYRMLELQTSL